jgi:hypothetical protein
LAPSQQETLCLFLRVRLIRHRVTPSIPSLRHNRLHQKHSLLSAASAPTRKIPLQTPTLTIHRSLVRISSPRQVAYQLIRSHPPSHHPNTLPLTLLFRHHTWTHLSTLHTISSRLRLSARTRVSHRQVPSLPLRSLCLTLALLVVQARSGKAS